MARPATAPRTKTATVSTKLPPFVPTAGGGSDTTDQYKVNGVSQWQSSIELTGLSAGTSYCYEAFSSTGALLAPSQSFSTLDATLPSTGLTFDVVATSVRPMGPTSQPAS